MAADIRCSCIREAERIAAPGSGEMDPENGTVEMTDFAGAPGSRGKGLAVRLLAPMEAEMAHRGIHFAFTISRSASFAINITFKRAGYQYAGALVNNPHIGGRIEIMWVWFKLLGDSG
jgi:putative beta-lysine N-acetyltransferase